MRFLPHIAQAAFSIQQAHPLQIHMSGVRTTFPGGDHSYYFVYTEHWPEDANSIIQSIWNYINLHAKPGQYRELHLSFDNHSTQHNNYILAFCYLLIKLNFFERVIIIFFIAGEGYSRADQAHRVLHSCLWNHDIFDMDQLIDAINKKHVGVWMQHIFDWKALFDKEGMAKMEHFSGAHQ